MKRTAIFCALAALPFTALANDSGLASIVITGRATAPGSAAVAPNQIRSQQSATSDTASLLRDVPGVSLYGAGGASSLPVIHGLADDRLRIKVDGMDLIAACPNHMNPALSYLDPSNVAQLKVYAGISPVSVGGDSIGGTVLAETPAPVFATNGQTTLTQGEIGGFYRSNGNATGGNIAATLASETLHIRYSGSVAKADNYEAGDDFKNFTATGRSGHSLARDEVGSTAYDSSNQALTLAYKHDGHLLELKLGYQNLNEQLYPNQRMDMLDNEQHRAHLRYLGQFDWGSLDARVYRETVDHFMNFGEDKQLVYGTALNGMPMNTESETVGASLTASIDLNPNEVVRLGAEMQSYELDDWWPASGTGMMAPGTFWNIRNGERDRTGVFAEWEARQSSTWLTLLGARYEHVSSDAGNARGYNPTSNGMGMMMNYQQRDADAFNARDHRQTDHNLDLTALARYTASSAYDIELGVARKLRSPNLYERYTWSSWSMAAIMNNTVGDGNGYFGDVNLKREKAYTASATFDWHAVDRLTELKVSPHYTQVSDYIDAVQWNSTTNQPATSVARDGFSVLKYANQKARIYGIDVSGKAPLGQTGLGAFGIKGLVSYLHGTNRDTDDDLYNIMPLHTKLTLTHQSGRWDNALEFVAVSAKDEVSDVRNEIDTSGYSLVNLRGSYAWPQARFDLGIENLFDRAYDLPLGGAYAGQGTTMGLNSIPWGIAVPGMGRSMYAGFTLKF